MDKETRELLKTEWLLIHQQIDAHDGRMLTIKAWSVTAGTAGLGAALATERALLPVVAGSALMFWFTEALWKSFQHAHYPRLKEIERYFADEKGEPLAPLQTNRSWNAGWKPLWRTGLPSLMFFVHVMIPHVFVVAAAVLLYVFGGSKS